MEHDAIPFLYFNLYFKVVASLPSLLYVQRLSLLFFPDQIYTSHLAQPANFLFAFDQVSNDWDE